MFFLVQTMPRRTRSARIAPFSVILSLALVSAPAYGEETSASSVVSAQTEYRRAHEEMNRGNWAQARQILLGLWARAKTYDVAASLAETEMALGEHTLAGEHMSFAIEHVAPKEKPETVEKYRAALAKIRSQLGSVVVTVSEPEATVTVDGRVVGSSPLAGELYLEPGPHRIVAKLGGHEIEKNVQVALGGQQRIALELPAPQEANPELGTAPPPAAAPPAPAPRAPASSAPADASSGIAPRTIALVGGSAVTAILLGVGIGESIRASNAQDDVDRLKLQALDELGQNCPRGSTLSSCADLASATERRNSANRWETVAFVGAGAAAAATIVLALALPSGATGQESEPPVTISLAPSGASLGFRTSF